MSEKSIRKIFMLNKYKPYKPRFIHTLKEEDFNARIDFCFWYQDKIEQDPIFGKHILFTGEATFNSNGVVSFQNCRWWSDENLHFVIDCKDQYLFKTNVWCGILGTQVLGPFFFRGNCNAAHYLQFLRNKLSDELDELPLAKG